MVFLQFVLHGGEVLVQKHIKWGGNKNLEQ